MPVSTLFCEHANEVPALCPCDVDCYCRSNTCRDRPFLPSRIRSSSQRTSQHPEAFPKLILGILGLAGSGKDSVAKFFGSDCGYCNVAFADPLKRIARDVYDFSEEQLWGPSEMRNMPDERYPRQHSWPASMPDRPNWNSTKPTCTCCGRTEDEAKEAQCYLTPRFALQILGTQFGRHCFEDTWAQMGVRTAKTLLQNGDTRYDQKRGLYTVTGDGRSAMGVTISDVRFRNEMRIIREAGGKVIRIKRPGAGLKGASGLHESEAEQASIPDTEFDAVIHNDRDLEHLRAVSIPVLKFFRGVSF